MQSASAVGETLGETDGLALGPVLGLADGDVEALQEMFCEDGVFVSERGRYEGRDELRGFYERVVEPPTNKPFIHNHLIEVDGDRASGRCAVEAAGLLCSDACASAPRRHSAKSSA